jgi:lysyl-tRNA synthetase class 2
LKRCIVGGLERVFEIARNFRNEGLSPRHNPEFSMLELYEAQADYRRMMEIAETMIESVAREVNGTSEVSFRGERYELRAPFERHSYCDLFLKHVGCAFDDQAAVRAKAAQLEIHDPGSFAKLSNDVFEACVEEHLRGPVIVFDYPVEISPLAKRKPGQPRIAERFEVFLGGMELGNAFSELNDPADQYQRFAEQVASKDPEAPGEIDIDYVQALEYGMPPAGGLGIGIDRLVMVLTGQDTIRDVLLFPALRPRTEAPADSAEQATS